MPFDAFDEAYSLAFWRGIPLQCFQTTVGMLRGELPDFELRPFGAAPNNHPRMRSIVRLATSVDRYERPVAAVSDRYELIQHRVIAIWLHSNLAKEGLGDAKANVDITEYGERMRVTVPLPHLETALLGDKKVGDKYAPELVVTNSVDRSCALSVALRWRRLVCRNGMFVFDEDRMRSVHHVSMSRTDAIRTFMADRLAAPPSLQSELQRWAEIAVTSDAVKTWVETRLRDRNGWTVETCARIWAIIDGGYDGVVTRPKGAAKRHKLSDYRVGQHRLVPGISFPIKTAYDVAQILTWVTSRHRSIEVDTEAADEVPALIGELLGGR